MLDKNFFKEQMLRMSVLFPNWNVNLTDRNTLKYWYQEFEDLSNKDLKTKIDIFVSNSQYNPTVAAIKNSFKHEKKVNQDNATAEDVIEKLRKQGYDLNIDMEG